MTETGFLTFFEPMIGTAVLSAMFALALIVEGALIQRIYYRRFWL